MPAVNRRMLLDGEDSRLTASERHVLRQIAFRLQSSESPQPREDKTPPWWCEADSPEEELTECLEQ